LRLEETEWHEPESVEIIPGLLQAAGGDRILAEALVRRGIETSEQAAAFLDPRNYQQAPASDLPDMDRAVERLVKAISGREQIGIWGDFDVDGQTATAVLYAGLNKLGANVSYYIPVRARESHGLTIPGLTSFLDKGIRLLLTCDTGISAHAEVEFAQTHGVDVLITDHHTLPPDLPNALAVVNPQRLHEGHPLNPLCGVGCAYKLIESLFTYYQKSDEVLEYLDLVAIGTIADLAKLTGENRYFVQRGVERIRSKPRPAIQAILDLASINHTQLSEEHISFILAPRLSALGRLSDANPAVPFLLCQGIDEAKTMAVQLETLNSQRKLLCDQVFQAAQSQLDQDPNLLHDPVLVLSHPNWPAGVIGIAASRLVELYNRPVILIACPPGSSGRGSARSVEGINITAALEKNQGLLITYGGHPMAAGFSIEAEKIQQFRLEINNAVKAVAEEKPIVRQIRIDAYLPLERLTMDLVETLDRLAPYGPGNPSLTMATRNLVLRSFSPIGKGAEHLQLIVEDPTGATRKVIWWQGAGFPLPEDRFDLAYSVRASNYRGERSVQIEWVNARPIQEETKARIPRMPVELMDFRKEAEPLKALERLGKPDDILIWQEGEKVSGVTGLDRFRLHPAATLALWNIPPGLTELRGILSVAQPTRVAIFGQLSANDKPGEFLTRLAGLIRFAINKRKGRVSIQDLAALTAQRVLTVRKGIEWWSAQGEITFTDEPEAVFALIQDGSKNLTYAGKIESELIDLLQETAAFRSYFMRASPDQLVD
jgi:single-stranded-DNA-specific exonuclease